MPLLYNYLIVTYFLLFNTKNNVIIETLDLFTMKKSNTKDIRLKKEAAMLKANLQKRIEQKRIREEKKKNIDDEKIIGNKKQ